MNKFLTLSVLSLLMLGNQSSAMEKKKCEKLEEWEKYEQQQLKLKERIFGIVTQYPYDLTKLDNLHLDSLGENDQANVLCRIICNSNNPLNNRNLLIKKLIKKGFKVNGLDQRGVTPLSNAVARYIFNLGKV